ncbi:MAG TPA: GLPGLI family protein [Pedobacter sp.]|uniref:GLPGLI family protein n=1 Tax=Pedobacter sp. TaxID=1411316 RepID=UPI002D11B250|nr:GLPGLI family protein [Pedobacter sp.]HMI02204.1 GLPGLI family protein [Pedobacter sp.]
MKQLFILIACFFAFPGNSIYAQNRHFITSGVIEFERTANMFALVKKKVTKNTLENKPYYERYLRTEPQFRKLKSTLTFDGNTMLFTPVAAETNVHWWYDSPMANQLNIIFSDVKNGTSTIQKEFYERTYLVKDTIRKIRWKITEETREIAGYKCRRANGIMLDSIYVVAFYTDRIHVPGGPESFNGLPGMILGVAVPHEHVSWFATKISEQAVDTKKIAPPKKGKEVNNKQMREEIMKAIGNQGDYAIVQLKGLLL